MGIEVGGGHMGSYIREGSITPPPTYPLLISKGVVVREEVKMGGCQRYNQVFH